MFFLSFFSSSKAVDFLDKLLRYDHLERPTAKEAMVSLYYLSLTNIHEWWFLPCPCRLPRLMTPWLSGVCYRRLCWVFFFFPLPINSYLCLVSYDRPSYHIPCRLIHTSIQLEMQKAAELVPSFKSQDAV